MPGLWLTYFLFWPNLAHTFDVGDINGYYLHTQNEHLDQLHKDPNAAVRPDALECPSDNVITSTYRCQVSWGENKARKIEFISMNSLRLMTNGLIAQDPLVVQILPTLRDVVYQTISTHAN